MNAPRTDSTDNMQTEAIRPLAVARKHRTHRQRTVPLDFILGTAFCAFLIIIIAGGLWLYRDLTRTENQIVTTSTAPEKPSAPTLPERQSGTAQDQATSPREAVTASKNLAQERRNQFLAFESALEEKGVQQWGGEGYTTMTDLGRQADRLWSEKQYDAAAGRYAAALAEADRLAMQKDGTLQQTLEAAQQALARGDAAKAAELFALVQLMEAENKAAAKGLQRAQNYGKVTALVQTGKAHEDQGETAAAKAAYESALALDPDAQEARMGLQRATQLVTEARFKKLLSEALTAMDRGDFATARSKLLQAGRMQPNHSAVQDAMSRLDQSVRVEEIKQLEQNALAAEARENWEQALALYLMVLEMDPNIQFAKKGRIHSQDRIRISKRVRFFTANPDALTQDPQLQSAMALMDEARQLKPRGPVLTAELDRLEAIIRAAATPVKVVLTSDEHTDVAVYKVGRLGRFKEHVLELRPGTYTVVGSRDGYQDVRKHIVVKPQQDTVHMAVVCSVKI